MTTRTILTAVVLGILWTGTAVAEGPVAPAGASVAVRPQAEERAGAPSEGARQGICALAPECEARTSRAAGDRESSSFADAARFFARCYDYASESRVTTPVPLGNLLGY